MNWELFGQVIRFLNGTITVLLLVGGLLAFAFRTYVSEWIKNRFGRTLQTQIEDHKHKLARDMEVYRNSLVQELEHFRANVDIRRSVALRIAESKIEALRELAPTLDVFINEASTMPQMEPAVRRGNFEAYKRSVDAVRASVRKASLHISRELDVRLA